MTDPIFCADLTDLKGRLRLAQLPPTSAANDILDQAILEARLTFYRRLGTATMSDLLSVTYVPNPSTEDQIKRALALTVEVKLVRERLLRTLPHLWMDASGDANKAWNDEAPYRERGISDVERELKRLHDEIEEDFQILEGNEDSIGDESNWRSYNGVRECPAPRPGGSVNTFTSRPLFPD